MSKYRRRLLSRGGGGNKLKVVKLWTAMNSPQRVNEAVSKRDYSLQDGWAILLSLYGGGGYYVYTMFDSEKEVLLPTDQAYRWDSRSGPECITAEALVLVTLQDIPYIDASVSVYNTGVARVQCGLGAHHIAFVAERTPANVLWTMYYDGQVVNTATTGLPTIDEFNIICQTLNSDDYRYCLSFGQMRVTEGKRYDGNFTPPNTLTVDY